MVKDTDNIYYSTKNEVRGLCVGGDMVILFFCHFTEFGENGPHPYFWVLAFSHEKAYGV